MAPRQKPKEALILIIDVRRSESQQNRHDQLVFSKVKECAKQILLRRVLGNSIVDLAVVVLGSEHSNTSVDEDLSYEHIKVLRELQPPSWGMVEDVLGEQDTPSTCKGDILEAVVVAMSLLRKQGLLAYTASKVVLVTHACGSSQFDGLDVVIKALKNMAIEVTVIGPNIAEQTESQGYDGRMDEPLTECSVLARMAVETEGLVCRFEDALPQLSNFETRKVRPSPWKTGFEIGPDITIPIMLFLKVSPVAGIKPKIERISDDDGSLADKDYVYTVHSATSADEKPVDKYEIIDGYNFGSTIVPFSAYEKAELSYQSGPRSLKLLYFTAAENVPKHLHIGGGTAYIFPAEEERCIAAFGALVQGMKEENAVAICRRVYNNNNNPTLLMLSPQITPECTCLVAVGLPYADDIKHFLFGPLTTKKSQPSAEQLQAVDDLISNMNLMEVPDEDGECVEAFAPESTLDPGEQHLYEIICYRALNPEKTEIPKPSENVRKMLEPPVAFQEMTKPVLERIKALFPLEEKKLREGTRKAAADIFKQGSDFKVEDVQQDEPNPQPSTIKKIGTITPVIDFNRMLEEKQVPFKEVCVEMQSIVWNSIELAFDMEDMKKAVLFVQALRSVCIKQDPNHFNSWIHKLKSDLPQPKKSFLKLLVDEKIALITRDESELSSVSKEEAEALLREEDTEMTEEPAQSDDLDDLLKDM